MGFTSASDVYSVGIFHIRVFFTGSEGTLLYFWICQLKRKRVGAGQRGSSNPFQTAKELLKSPTSGPDSVATNNEAPPAVACTIKARATAVSASINSPTKAGRGVSKKQQKLAEAAKTSRNISQYFMKKQTTETRLEERETGLDSHMSEGEETSDPPSSPAVKVVELSPTWSDSRVVVEEESKAEVIRISDSETEEQTMVEPESTTE